MKSDSIVEYYIENRRIKDFDEQRRINGEIKRKRKMQVSNRDNKEREKIRV